MTRSEALGQLGYVEGYLSCHANVGTYPNRETLRALAERLRNARLELSEDRQTRDDRGRFMKVVS